MKNWSALSNWPQAFGQAKFLSTRAFYAGLIFFVSSTLPSSGVIGKVFAWGDNSSGQTNVPPSLTNVVAIAAGDYFSLALKADGKVAAWGQGSSGQTNVPADLSNVVAIAAGARHCLVLKQNTTITTWGDNSQNQLNMPSGLTNIAAIAAGYQHSLALKKDGTVAAWGWNAYNQTNVPSGLSNVMAIAGGYYHSLALKQDGTVAAWGGSLYINVPSGLSNVIAIAAGYYHSLALKDDGTVVAWGKQTDVPAGVTNIVAIATHLWQDYVSDYNLVLKDDGAVAAWGKNTPLQTDLPPNLTNVLAIALGFGDGLALLGDGSPVVLEQPASWAGYCGSEVLLQVKAMGPPPLHYQWQRNGNNLPAAANASLLLARVQSAEAGNYSVIVSNSLGRTVSSNALVTVFLTFNDCIDSARPWVMPGDAPWFGEVAVTHDGTGAVQTSPIADSQRAILRTAVTGPGILSFWWKVSSQTNSDFLEFHVAGVRQAAISGEADWQPQSVSIPVGLQTVEWIYSKDSALASGADAAWVDQLTFRPALYTPGLANHAFAVMIPTDPAKHYTLEFKASLTDVTWTPVNTVQGTGNPLLLADPAATGPQGFYRVREW